MSLRTDQALWRLREQAAEQARMLSEPADPDERRWLAYALVLHRLSGGPEPLRTTELIDVGRQLSQLHLHWREVGAWPLDEPIPADAWAFQLDGVPAIDLVLSDTADPLLRARMVRVALQTVRELG